MLQATPVVNRLFLSLYRLGKLFVWFRHFFVILELAHNTGQRTTWSDPLELRWEDLRQITQRPRAERYLARKYWSTSFPNDLLCKWRKSILITLYCRRLISTWTWFCPRRKRRLQPSKSMRKPTKKFTRRPKGQFRFCSSAAMESFSCHPQCVSTKQLHWYSKINHSYSFKRSCLFGDFRRK